MTIFFNFSPTSNHLHPLQVENLDSNSRLVVDEDDNGKSRLERVNSDTNEKNVTFKYQVHPRRGRQYSCNNFTRLCADLNQVNIYITDVDYAHNDY